MILFKIRYKLQLKAGHTRYPVVTNIGKLVGIVTARDVFLQEKDALIKEVIGKKSCYYNIRYADIICS